MSSSAAPPLAANPSTHHSNGSEYTLATVHFDDREDSPAPSDRSALLAENPNNIYGTTFPQQSGGQPSSRKLLFNAAIKMALVFLISTLVLGGTLWLALPPLDEEDRPTLRIPKSFDQLQALNQLLKKYRDIYPFRIVVSFVTTYFFVQAFSLPGSMYLSILGGAMWGVPIALPLACTCVATGASLCYLISAAFGPALLTLPKFAARLESFSDKVASQRANLLSFLIVLRISPLPPHWVVNVLCPHLGIGLPLFWISSWLGIFGVTVIHTTIGEGLDQMTSPDDFHLISWKNFFLLAAIVAGVLIPVGLRYFFSNELREVADVEQERESGVISLPGDDDIILAQGPPSSANKGKTTGQLVLLPDSESDGEYSDGDDPEEDIILEAGPAIAPKQKEAE
ncbi:oxalate transporter [Neolentinus lepideus HHB14362 ss-1]|uniref:Oxalate transporter n=1 Tax=Neolentinus lepideus HHB14362 ss-1 TaxID=1314782 RepID=A0A165VNN7_9AGAM|nr:oxalate transporter [Neolentinus lepideus HHB14362 ss-1]